MHPRVDENPNAVATRPVAPRRLGGCTVLLSVALLLSVSLNLWLLVRTAQQQQRLDQLQSKPALPAVVPIEYSSTGHPIIPVKIGGETFWWILDTGATNTVLYAERFPIAKYVRRVKGSSSIRYPLMGFRIEGYVGIIEGLQVDGMLLPRHTVVIERLANYPLSHRPCERVSGVLGTDILRHYRCVLTDGYLRLEPSRADIPEHAVPLEWGRIGNNPVFEATINGHRLKMLLDTGLSHQTPFLVLREDVWRKILRQARSLHLKVSKVDLKSEHYGHTQPKFPVDNEAWLGVQILRLYRVTIDFPQQRIWFDSSLPTPEKTRFEFGVIR